MSAAIRNIENLRREMNACRDPERLRKLARLLTEYGQWVEAKRAENKAHEIERQYAEEAMK